MNTTPARSGKRVVRRELSIAISLITSLLGATQTVFADGTSNPSHSENDLPTLVDPAGILDPELLSILNAMSSASPDDEFLDEDFLDNDLFEDEFFDEDSWDPEADIVDLLSSSELLKKESDAPVLGAAIAADPNMQYPKIPISEPMVEQPSLIDPSEALEELGITPAPLNAKNPVIKRDK